MRIGHIGHAAVIAAIIGTLAIFLLPLPHASAPYPATHGPLTFPRSSRMAVMICFAKLVLLVFATLTVVRLFSVQSLALFGQMPSHFAPRYDRLSLKTPALRC